MVGFQTADEHLSIALVRVIRLPRRWIISVSSLLSVLHLHGHLAPRHLDPLCQCFALHFFVRQHYKTEISRSTCLAVPDDLCFRQVPILPKSDFKILARGVLRQTTDKKPLPLFGYPPLVSSVIRFGKNRGGPAITGETFICNEFTLKRAGFGDYIRFERNFSIDATWRRYNKACTRWRQNNRWCCHVLRYANPTSLNRPPWGPS